MIIENNYLLSFMIPNMVNAKHIGTYIEQYQK